MIARAGTGKTRVLTRRIAWRSARGDLDVRRMLAITFTTRAAEELQTRLAALIGRDTGTIGTFHAVAWRMLRDHHLDRHKTPPTILEDPGSLIAESIPRRYSGASRLITNELAWAGAQGLDASSYPDAARRRDRNVPFAPDVVASVLTAYARNKRRRGVVDFDDIITGCVEMLDADTEFAAAQRWRHRHFFVDEYQDVNPIQHRFLDALLADRTDLFVVGDPDQAIYGFNGANPRYLTDFKRRYPDATVIDLTVNYRSTPEVVRAADAVLGRSTPLIESADAPACTVTACADADDEAVTIARAIRREHVPARRWSAQCVLVRTNAQARHIADVLERAGIPVADRPFTDAEGDRVTVTSFHSAKGLEWPIVHVAGLEEGYVPDRHARSNEELAEERHLFHVALSRATRNLHLTWAKQRTFGERTVGRTPSRWLAAVTGALGPTPERRPRRQTSGPVDAPSPVSTTAVNDDARTRLADWREHVARAASVPVSVVLTDSVLDELIRLAPTDPAALAQVPGLGAVKAGRYGRELLDALNPGDRP